jgi:hypothetical protein
MNRQTWFSTLVLLTMLAVPWVLRAAEPAPPPASPAASTQVPDQAAAPAAATTGSPRWPGPHLGLRRLAAVDVQGAYNPLGIQVLGSLVLRNVYEVDQKRNIEWAYLQAGLGILLNPAYAQVSVHMEWAPAAFLTLRFDTALFGYFGVLGALRQFDSFPEKSDVDRNASSLPGHDRTGFAYRVMLQPTLALQQGWFIFRNQCNIAMYRFVGRGAYFYEYENDTVMAPTELLIYNQLWVLAQVWKAKRDATLMIGALYDVTYTAVTDLRRQRVGGLFLWQPKDPWGPLDRLRIYVMAGVILEDRNRKYEPFVAGGFGTDFDL